MSREGLTWTPEDLAAHYLRLNQGAQAGAVAAEVKKPTRSQPVRGQMNKTELSYSMILEAKRELKEIECWRFERMTFVLAPKNGKIAAVRYTPDFSVVTGGKIRLIEIKAGRKSKSGSVRPHFEDGARERLLFAAREFPEFEWVLAWKWKQTWEEEVL